MPTKTPILFSAENVMRDQPVRGSIGLGGAMEDGAAAKDLLKRLDAVIEQIEEVIGRPEIAADAAVRVQFEETLESLRKTRKKIAEGPSIQ